MSTNNGLSKVAGAPLKLITTAGCTLTNPFLKELIKAAPSPKSIDNHVVKELNLGNSLAKRLRAAVKLKQQYPHIWEEVIQTNTRPAKLLFNYIGGIADCLLLGGVKIRLNMLPIFLREHITSGFHSSFDSGIGKNYFVIISHFSEDIFFRISSVPQQIIYAEDQYYYSIKMSIDFISDEDGPRISFWNQANTIAFFGQLAVIKMRNEIYPGLYKIVRIVNKVSEGVTDYLDFLFRLDKLKNKSSVHGYGKYKRVVTLRYSTDKIFPTRLELSLPVTIHLRPETERLYLRLINGRNKAKLIVNPLGTDLFASDHTKEQQKINMEIVQLLTYLSKIQRKKDIEIELEKFCDLRRFQHSLADILVY